MANLWRGLMRLQARSIHNKGREFARKQSVCLFRARYLSSHSKTQQQLDEEAFENRKLVNETSLMAIFLNGIFENNLQNQGKHFQAKWRDYHWMTRLVLQAQLNHPLINKYKHKFSVDEFIEGAQQVALQLLNASNSPEFLAYTTSGNKSASNATIDFLSEVCYPHVVSDLAKLKALNPDSSKHHKGKLTKENIVDWEFGFIHVRMCPHDLDSEINPSNPFIYPTGATMLLVDSIITIDRNPSSNNAENRDSTEEEEENKMFHCYLRLEACLSDHMEMDWKVVKFEEHPWVSVLNLMSK